MHGCAEQVDPLAAGNLGVQPELLGHLSQHDQFLGRDLAPGNARNHRVQAPALNVGQEPIVRVLKRGVVHHVLVPEAGQDRRDGRLADLAAVPLAVAADQLGERLDPLDLDDLKEFLARVGEMLAEVIDHFLAQRRQLGLEQVGHQRQAAAAAGAGPGAVLDLGQRRQAAVADGLAHLELADVVARANLGAVGRRCRA